VNDGHFTIGLRVIDDDGQSSFDTAHVTVNNVAPTASAGGPYTAAPNVPVTFAGIANDPGADLLTYEWDFDYVGGVFTVDASGVNLANPSHTYGGVGSHTVVLRVRDDDGGVSGVATASVTVTDVPPVPDDVLYFSLLNGATVGGVPAANEDILALDADGGVRILFDGSDVGLGGLVLGGFHVIGTHEILLSFTAAASLAGVGTVDDSDIVLFTASSLGTATSGSFSLYFDGSDVGLTTSSEVIDAIGRLGDGRLLVSTTSNVSVPGASGVAADLLVFNPSSLGSNTSGTWSLYFDASDVGLTTSNENVDATAVDAEGNIYLSTSGNFSVSGVSGADEDVFVFTPTALGGSTSGSFSSALFFDGSLLGLAANDVSGIDIALSAAAPAPFQRQPTGGIPTPSALNPVATTASTAMIRERMRHTLAVYEHVFELLHLDARFAPRGRMAWDELTVSETDDSTAAESVEAGNALLAIDLAFIEE
jgi:PKD repeat protein